MNILDSLLSVIAPHACLGCNAEGILLCINCRTIGLTPLPERCYKCYALSKDSRVCEKCRPRNSLRHVWIATEYTGLAKEVVHNLKFERALAASQPIGQSMTERLPFLDAATVVVAVPTASARIRQRGYDHAALLAKEVARLKKLHHVSALARSGQTRQVGASRQQRMSQLTDAFRVVRSERIKGADILLVDDIVTTGSTLEAAAKVLRRAGVRSVSAAVFAQKL